MRTFPGKGKRFGDRREAEGASPSLFLHQSTPKLRLASQVNDRRNYKGV